ncbi:hypothetical protein BDV93DRAFT_585782 [Ceratobasidium sp. AG-I]|nr:hypothetical protein BDV93DRAFT_585782 [Ceratobasidium sp. AG-I]
MDVGCPHCGSFHWRDEKLSSSTRNNILFGSCCHQGKIEVALPQRPPPTLWRLFTGIHPASDNFFSNIWEFDSALAFVSMGSDQVEHQQGHGPYLYKIGGQVYHRSSDLAPEPAQNPDQHAPPRQYAQLWVYDPQDSDQLDGVVDDRIMRAHANGNCDRPFMRELTGVLQEHHAYAPLYCQIWETLQGQPVQNLSMVIRQNSRYNRPTSNELALIVPNNSLENQRDIFVHLRGGGV